jgi:Competence protein J (ComJ)
MNTWPTEELTISFSQLILYQAGIKKPFLEWEEDDIKRGYIKTNDVLSFETLSDSTCEISVQVSNQYKPIEGSVRSHSLPFEVKEDGITVSSVGQKGLLFKLPKGLYTIYFDAMPLEHPNLEGLYRVKYSFQFISA